MQREARSTFWFSKPSVVGAGVYYSTRVSRWVFCVPHSTKEGWATIEHRHLTREAAEAEGIAWAVAYVLEE